MYMYVHGSGLYCMLDHLTFDVKQNELPTRIVTANA